MIQHRITMYLGGHTAEMMQLMTSLDPTKYTPRSYIMAYSDRLSEYKAIEYEHRVKTGHYSLYKIPRAREVGQPLKTVMFTMIIAIIKSIHIMMIIQPDLIICNGPGSCLPICILSYIPRIIGIKKIDIIYVESFARVHSLSFTAKLLYYFADRMLVQWPELSERYPRCEYKGILV